MGRVALIILDGLGIGACPDQEEYGDGGSDTLGNVARAVGGLETPFLAALGLGCCRPIPGLACTDPRAAYGVALPRSKGKDSTTGHWEICELLVEQPFPVYPDGFPPNVVETFARRTGRGVLANRPASGTAIIEQFGAEQMRSGAWIVYTSADSVFQIAAHEEVIPLDELYAACQSARAMLQGEHGVSRVIARPYRGEPGAFHRTAHRRDFSLPPAGPTLLDRLAEAGVPRVGVGKVDDLFAARSITSRHTPTNRDAYVLVAEALTSMDRGLLFVNVIEFDQSWGHRNDVAGFYQGLQELDRELPRLIDLLQPDDLMLLTADHGTDPTTDSTDHSREAVPLLAVGPGVRAVDLGTRSSFADIGATVADYFGIQPSVGDSFLGEILG